MVEAACRLVEKEQPRPACEGARELDALQRPVRETGRRPVRVLGDPDVGERLERDAALLPLALQAGRDVRADEDVLEHGERGEELEVLEGAGDPEPDHAARPHTLERAPVEHDISEVEPVEARDRVEGGRLPGAVRSDQPDDRACGDLERDVVERDDPAEPEPSVVEREQRHPSARLQRSPAGGLHAGEHSGRRRAVREAGEQLGEQRVRLPALVRG